MRRHLAWVLALLILPSNGVHALGLGPLKTSSSLNEPFEATIELVDAQSDELDNLTIGLADREQFRRAGVDYAPTLFQLKFELVQPEQGADYIKITSRESVREPFLNFLLQLNWSKGRIIREYTVLLDPPLYDPTRKAATRAPSVAEPSPDKAVTTAPTAEIPRSSAVDTGAPEDDRQPIRDPDPRKAPRTSGGAETYGPTAHGDTLWSIAQQLRPSSGVSIQQMMLGLLRANPSAFIDNNINLLKRGYVLRLPDSTATLSVSNSEALAEVKRQNALWEEYRQRIAAAPLPRPAGTAAAGGTSGIAAPVEGRGAEAHLKLISAAQGTASDEDAVSGGDLSEAADGEMASELALAREQLEAREQENEDLRSRLTESDEIIELLRRQVELKDQELAALQARLAAAGQETQAELTPGEQSGEAKPLGVEEETAAEGLPGSEAATDEGAPSGVETVETLAPGEETPAAEPTESITEEESVRAETARVEEAIAEGQPGTEPVTAPQAQGEVAPAEGSKSLLDGVLGFVKGIIPEDRLASIPGGLMTLLGVVGAVLLLSLLIVRMLFGRSKEVPAAEDVLTAPRSAAGNRDEVEDGSDLIAPSKTTVFTQIVDVEADMGPETASEGMLDLSSAQQHELTSESAPGDGAGLGFEFTHRVTGLDKAGHGSEVGGRADVDLAPKDASDADEPFLEAGDADADPLFEETEYISVDQTPASELSALGTSAEEQQASLHDGLSAAKLKADSDAYSSSAGAERAMATVSSTSRSTSSGPNSSVSVVSFEPGSEEIIDTKLNLAKAYIELGDPNGAKAILEDVANEGNDEQKHDAEELLKQTAVGDTQ